MAYSNFGITEATPMDPAQTNIWATTVNTNMTIIDNAVAGALSLSVAGSANVVLTSTAGAANQFRNTSFTFTGILTGNINILYPAGVTFKFSARNSTTGAFSLSVGVTDGSGLPVGKVVTIPQGAVGTLFSDGTDVVSIGSTFTTRQTFTSGSGATYTAPNGCTRLFVRAAGAGGGGGSGGAGSGAGGSNGSATTFNSVAAGPGFGGIAGTNSGNVSGGAGGAGGSGSATFRTQGQGGGAGIPAGPGGTQAGAGGGSLLGGGAIGGNGTGQIAGYGGGGSGGASTGPSGYSGGGGGGGEYVELCITNPAATYLFTVGTGGAGGVTGGANTGSAGGDGIIIVDEYY